MTNSHAEVGIANVARDYFDGVEDRRMLQPTPVVGGTVFHQRPDFGSLFHQIFGEVRPDEAGCSGHQYALISLEQFSVYPSRRRLFRDQKHDVTEV